jgi:hypothetical protein
MILMNNVDIREVAYGLEKDGYFRIPNLFDPNIASDIKKEIDLNIENNYNEENLGKNAVYISDKSVGRESHAMMVAQGESKLPSVVLHGKILQEMLGFHNYILHNLTGERVLDSSRSMMNFQLYSGKSKPVAEHYDGHYMQYDKISPTEFRLRKGVLPRYVMVFNIANENKGDIQGTHFRNVETGETFAPPANPGSFIIFDNLKVRHWVPELTEPRIMLGFRNFDHCPVYFVDKEPPRTDCYNELKDANNPGYITDIGSETAVDILGTYYKYEWPKHWEEIKKQGAVF